MYICVYVYTAMTLYVCLVISLPNILYIHRVYLVMANPRMSITAAADLWFLARHTHTHTHTQKYTHTICIGDTQTPPLHACNMQ